MHISSSNPFARESHPDQHKCPKCNDNSGFYEKVLEPHTYYFMFDGCGDGEKEVIRGRGGIRKYCRNCYQDITRFVEQLPKESHSE